MIRSMENPASENHEQPAGPSPREQLAAAYDRYVPGLYRYGLMILADPSAAQDAVHQAFVKLAARGEGISQIASCNGYLRTAVRNECYRILRQHKEAGKMHVELAAILEPVER